MPNYTQKSSVGWLDAFKGSSIPFLSSSIAVAAAGAVTEIRFPSVTKSISIKNTVPTTSASEPIRVGFSLNGVNANGYPHNSQSTSSPGPNTNYIVLDNEESYSADHRVSKVFIRGDGANSGTCQIAAGLTTIPFSELELNWSGSTGVG